MTVGREQRCLHEVSNCNSCSLVGLAPCWEVLSANSSRISWRIRVTQSSLSLEVLETQQTNSVPGESRVPYNHIIIISEDPEASSKGWMRPSVKASEKLSTLVNVKVPVSGIKDRNVLDWVHRKFTEKRSGDANPKSWIPNVSETPPLSGGGG